MLTTSALSWIHRGARRLLLKRDRQRHRQGDERHKADGWEMMRGERRNGTWIQSLLLSLPLCLPFYLSICQHFFHIYSPPFSFAYGLSSLLPLFLSLSSSYSMTSLFFFIQFNRQASQVAFFFLWMLMRLSLQWQIDFILLLAGAKAFVHLLDFFLWGSFNWNYVLFLQWVGLEWK